MTNPQRWTISTYTDWYSIANAAEYSFKQESHCLYKSFSKSIENDYDPGELQIYALAYSTSQRKCNREALGKASHPNFMQVMCNFHNIPISSAQFLSRIPFPGAAQATATRAIYVLYIGSNVTFTDLCIHVVTRIVLSLSTGKKRFSVHHTFTSNRGHCPVIQLPARP